MIVLIISQKMNGFSERSVLKLRCLTLVSFFFCFFQVPSLNDVPLHYLKPNSLVKFRCMVQDMFDPEFFMGVYETNDPKSNSKVCLSLPNRSAFAPLLFE